MYNPSVLIISKRQELAFKYKKILKLLLADTVLVDNLSDGMGEIKKNKFEFIIVSDTVEENIKGFIKKVRILTYNFRPTIIAVSKSAELSDKLELLDAGADDFLSEAMPNKEFRARLNAHIRRHVESLTNPLTGFLEERLTRKTLDKVLEKGENTSIILVCINNITNYREIYGEIAMEKVLQTTGAIISSALTKDDTIGHIGQNEFLIFTNIYKSEKLAEFLTFAFDNVLKRFYNDSDFSSNFTMTKTNSKEEKRAHLMNLSAAVIETKGEDYKNTEDVIQSLFNLIKPLKDSDKSSYIVDRPKLYESEKNKILIMETDEALGLLIETSCKINGYRAKNCRSYENFIECIKDFKPHLIILDYGKNNEYKGLEALEDAKKIYDEYNLKMPYVIFSTDILDKKSILSKGADFYLPKPYDIQTLINTIEDFLK